MSFEGIRSANIPDDGSRIAVARLIHDPREIRAALGRRRDVAGPQAVRSERRGIEPGGGAVALQDIGDGPVCKAAP